jgi:hypothetical protein
VYIHTGQPARCGYTLRVRQTRSAEATRNGELPSQVYSRNVRDYGTVEGAFEETCSLALSTDRVLRYYDVTKPVVLQTDASSKGLGAVLLQDGFPVAYASRTMTTTQQERYEQIEKELLAVVFACERFHQYIYGKTVEVHSDHKPLENILKKPLGALQ